MLGCFSTECKDGQIAAASAVTYVDPKDPPMLLIVGNKDKTFGGDPKSETFLPGAFFQSRDAATVIPGQNS